MNEKQDEVGSLSVNSKTLRTIGTCAALGGIAIGVGYYFNDTAPQDETTQPLLRAASAPATLLSAVQHMDMAEMKRLIATGADVNETDASGNTPLMLAIKSKSDEAVLRLLEAKADVHLANNAGESPITVAAAYGTADILYRLVDAGARVNQPNAKRLTPLMYAALN